jgi:hypothetical protein
MAIGFLEDGGLRRGLFEGFEEFEGRLSATKF